MAGVKKRKYDASRRRAAAARTRTAVLRAARDLFMTRGYANTSVADIAARAGVSVDTLYASVGRKPQLLLAVHDMELAEGDAPLQATERDYVKRIRAAASAVEMIEIYVDALTRLLPRTVPLLESLRVAGQTDRECLEAYALVSQRRAANMHQFASELRATGELRDDLDDNAVADLLWSLNAPDYFLLLRARGRTPEQYGDMIREVWMHTLLREPPRKE